MIRVVLPGLRGLLVPAIALSLVASCGSVGPDPASSRDAPRLLAVDSLDVRAALSPGLPAGHLLVSGASFTPAGDVLVLESMTGALLLFSRHGDLLSRAGGLGAGDGYFRWPSSLAVFPDGSVTVSDGERQTIELFDDSLRHLGRREFPEGGTPLDISPGLDGSILGRILEVTQGPEGEPAVRVLTGLWLEAGSSPDVVYMSLPCDVRPLDDGSIELEIPMMRSRCDPDGNVYCLTASPEGYRLLGFRPEGEAFMSASVDVEPVRRSLEEIESSIVFRVERSDGSGAPAQVDLARLDARPWVNAALALAVDSLGRAWVLLGSGEEPVFHVYDGSCERLLEPACPGLWTDGFVEPGLSFRYGGMLAWRRTPTERPFVYMLETAD
ncbi:hypothetical protein JW921_07610 [Candidatus Fermentibacterales bacterium]|nr:hypothetical protein [Candidatus Fermentibacterales bacterium]